MFVTRKQLAVLLFAPVILVASGCMNFRLPAIDPTGRGIFLPNPNYTTIAGDGPLGGILGGGGLPAGQLPNAFPGGGFGAGQPLGGFGGGATPLPGPYQPALFNKHRGQLARLFQHDGQLLQGIHNGASQVGNCGCNLLRGVGAGVCGLGRGLIGAGASTLGHLSQSCPLGCRGCSQCSPAASPLASLSGRGNRPAFETPATPPACGADGLAPAGSPCYPIGSPSQSSLSATLPNGNRSGRGLVSTQQVGLSRRSQLGPGVVIAQPRIRARVGDEVVVLGGVQSASGISQGGQPVQWSLSNDSVGTFVDTARRNVGRPRLLGLLRRTKTCSTGTCGNCLQSVTANRCDHLVRNPIDPNDDIYLSRGQSWVALTSAAPGVSYVTLSAPQLNGRRFQTATVEWIAADQSYSDNRDAVGPPDFEIVDDGANDSPSDQGPPFERIPEDRTPPRFDSQPGTDSPLPPAVENAQLIIDAMGPPGGTAGEPLRYKISVRNPSRVEANGVFVSTSLPQQVAFIDSDIEPIVENDKVAWKFDRLRPGESRDIIARFRASEAGNLRKIFYAQAQNAGEVNYGINTRIDAPVGPPLDLEVRDTPEPETPRVGARFTHPIRVVNRTGQPQDVTLVVSNWEAGIEPIPPPGTRPTPENGISTQFRLPSGPSQPIPIEFEARQPGTHRFRVSVTNGTSTPVVREGRVRVIGAAPPPRQETNPLGQNAKPQMKIVIEGPRPPSVDAGSTERFAVTFKNTGDVPLTNVRVEAEGGPDLVLSQATPGWTKPGDKLVWPVDPIPPGYGKTIEVECFVPPNPARTSATFTTRVTSDQGYGEEKFDVSIVERQNANRPRSPDRRTTTLKPVPVNSNSLSMTIDSLPESVRTGEQIEYRIELENSNRNSYRDVQVSVEIAEGMEFTGVAGPPATRTSMSADGLLIDFSSLREVLPSETISFRIRAKSRKAGIAKLLGRVHAIGLSKPINVLDETIVN